MKIAIAQLNPTIGDLPHNAAQILAAAQSAKAQGARLLLTPELALCGYPPRDLLLNPSFIEQLEQTLMDLVQRWPSGLAGLIGTVEPNPDAGNKPLFNSAALIDNHQILQHFHKRLLPTYDVFDEDRYFAPGGQPNHFHLDGEHIGVTICEDIWNDEAFWGKRSYEVNPIADLAALNVTWIANLSASPFCLGKQTIREMMLSHAAAKYKTPIAYVNQVGGNDDLIFDGGSLVLDASGTVIDRAPQFTPALQILDLQNAQAQAPRVEAPESAEVWSALVLGVRDYARKCGFSQTLLGLSGGIDSALVATIAAAALGPENVLGILMPSPYSSDHSITDAQDLAKNLGIQTQTIAIAPMMNSFDQSLAPLFSGTEFGVAEENLQSRIRGSLLMAIANKFGHLLLSTGNKSEMAVGYCTLYGDMNGGLSVIADLPKTKVFQLCHWLNTHQVTNLTTPHPIPENVLTKPPSAELKPGQVDQDSLPPYDILDDILRRWVEQHQSLAEILAAGHEEAVVTRITRLVKIAEFKRRQAAPGLKITDRAFGTGWRMPIAQRWPNQ
jgi:NAD+ synthase (glutamine-hydrolysing)